MISRPMIPRTDSVEMLGAWAILYACCVMFTDVVKMFASAVPEKIVLQVIVRSISECFKYSR